MRQKSLSNLLTFTRASTGTYVNSNGLIASAATDAARIEYDPITLAVRGLLIEEARTNYLRFSQSFENTSPTVWTATRATVRTVSDSPALASNLTTAPDGTTTASKLVDDATASNTHEISQSYTKTSSTEVQVYTASIWAKASGRTTFRLGCNGTSGTGNGAYTVFDLVLSGGSAPVRSTSGQYDNLSVRIEKWPGDWYRCSMTFRVNNDGQADIVFYVMMLGAAYSPVYSGDSSSGLLLWGAQLEKGAYVTSYIPTTSVAVTRARDVCTVTSLSPWFTEAEGTIYAEYLIPWTYTSLDTTSRRIIQADDGSDVDRVLLYAYAGNSRVALTETSTEQADLNVGAYTVGSARKVAVAWDTNDIAAIGNGGSLQTDTVAVIPSGLTTFRIGSASSAGSEPNAYIRKVRFYPRRMTNAELAALVA